MFGNNQQNQGNPKKISTFRLTTKKAFILHNIKELLNMLVDMVKLLPWKVIQYPKTPFVSMVKKQLASRILLEIIGPGKIFLQKKNCSPTASFNFRGGGGCCQ